MTDTLTDRVQELRAEAKRLGVDDSDVDMPDPTGAVIVYADLLGLDDAIVFDLSLTLDQIRVASAMVGGSR